MPKYFLDKVDAQIGHVLQLDKSDPVFHHLKQVLRVRTGAQIILCDGKSLDYHCTVKALDPLSLSLDSIHPCKTEPPCKITLYQAIPKADKLEWIIQKAVELGVYAIVPIYTEHAVIRPSRPGETKMARYQKIAESAAGQSMRGIIPVVDAPMTWDEAFKSLPNVQFMLAAYEKEHQQTLKTILDEPPLSSLTDIGLWIGPEGGFSEKEVSAMTEAGFKFAGLGPRILRTETAAIAALAQIMLMLER